MKKERRTALSMPLFDLPAFDARGQYISRYFNLLGGTRPLAFMDKSYFKASLDKVKDKLLAIKSIHDVQNKVIDIE